MREPIEETIDERVEVVILNRKKLFTRMIVIEVIHVANNLQTHGCIACALFAKNDGRRGFRGITKDLVPRRMIGVVNAIILEDRI